MHDNMKYKILIFTLLSAALFSSCVDFLDEDAKGKLPSDEFFSSKNDLAASLNSLYSVVATS